MQRICCHPYWEKNCEFKSWIHKSGKIMSQMHRWSGKTSFFIINLSARPLYKEWYALRIAQHIERFTFFQQNTNRETRLKFYSTVLFSFIYILAL